MSWLPFAAALAAFVAAHDLPIRTGLRDRTIARLGRRAWFAGYGLASLVLLGWMIAAAADAPYVELWPQLPWQRWAPNLVMPLVFVMAACGAGIRQPFTLGGRRGTAFDPADPGLAAVVRHPLLLALGLWAGAHLVPNGDLAHVILFGLFVLMALAGMAVFDRRAERELAGPARERFFRRTSALSVAPLADWTWLRRNGHTLARRALIGLALWLAALLLHGPVIGPSPLPL